MAMTLTLLSLEKRQLLQPFSSPESLPPDWEDHLLLLQLLPEYEDAFSSPALRVLSVYLPRVGPQDDKSFLED